MPACVSVQGQAVVRAAAPGREEGQGSRWMVRVSGTGSHRRGTAKEGEDGEGVSVWKKAGNAAQENRAEQY